MPKWNDIQRAELLARYRQSGLTQDTFCTELRAQGIDLSPRTLRSWIARLEPPAGVVEACLEALDLAGAQLRRVRAMLTAHRPTEEPERHPGSVEPCPSEPEPPTEAGLPDGIVAADQSRSPSPATVTAMPDGVPPHATPRKIGRVRWG